MSEQIDLKKFYPTAFVLYITYFVHGIGVSILGQYKQNFAQNWGAPLLADGTYDVSSVLMVIAALGLGRLITLPFSGTMSDKLGRKLSSLIGIVCYVLYFVGVVFAPNMYIAYVFALFGGAANSFLDTGVIPACMEIIVKPSGLAPIFTKLFISFGQLALPFMLGYVAAAAMPFTSIFFLMAIILVVVGVILIFMPMPPSTSAPKTKDGKKDKLHLTPEGIAVILIGFTCTSTFQLWLNCNQEFGKLAGMADPSQIQSYYSMGSIAAVFLTAVLVAKVRPAKFLIIYPVISAIMLFLVYLIATPTICIVGGFIIGFSAAGGVLQMATATINEMYPTAKGRITGILMIASSVANYVILSIAGAITKAGGVEGPKYVILLNLGVTVVGILLAIFVNMRYGKKEQVAA